jgi:hypothetical protein
MSGGDRPEPEEHGLDDYTGQWVAIRESRVVASATDETTLRASPLVREGDVIVPIGEPASGFYLINV